MMKKLLTILCIAALTLSALTACGSPTPARQESDVVTNTKWTEGEMTSISGKKLILNPEKDLASTAEFGFMLSLSDGYDGDVFDGFEFMFADPYSIVASYLPSKIEEQMLALHESEELTEDIQENMSALMSEGFELFNLLRVNAKDPDSKMFLEFSKDSYKYVEKLATIGDDTFYFMYNDEIPEGKSYTEEDLAYCRKLVAALPTVRENIILFPPEDSNEESVGGNLGSFSTEDLNGNAVTESVFRDYDITMVNIWATWCGACVSEMPELQKLYEQLPENVNLLSICTDGNEESELAKKILEKKNVKFPALIANEDMNEAFVEKFPSLPTTIFVDKDGNIVGNSIAGVPGRNEEIVPAYLEAINNALQAVNGEGNGFEALEAAE